MPCTPSARVSPGEAPVQRLRTRGGPAAFSGNTLFPLEEACETTAARTEAGKQPGERSECLAAAVPGRLHPRLCPRLRPRDPEASITDHRGLTRSSPVCPPSSPTTPGALSPSRSRSSASSPLGSEGEGQRLFLSLVFPDNRELKIVNIPKSIFRGANSAPPHISHVCV